MKTTKLLAPILIVTIGLGWLLPLSAAGPWYVSATGMDANDCLSPTTACRTIAGAIGKALSGDTIIVGPGTYTEYLNIAKSVTILGDRPATTIIDGGGIERVVQVALGHTVSLERVTLRNGRPLTGAGGGILNNGALSLQDVNVSGNSAAGNFVGGGIYNTQFGTLTVRNSTVTGNAASNGSGIANSGDLTLVNVTISGNHSVAAFGFGTGLHNSGTAMLTNVSIVGNSLDGGGMGALYEGAGTVQVHNSLLADNEGGNCGGNAITSLGGNLDSGATCGFGSGDLSNVDPLIAPLQDNGGLTFTHALLLGSPAINAAASGACPGTDQRGVPRPQGPACDIGAYEAQIRHLYLPFAQR